MRNFTFLIITSLLIISCSQNFKTDEFQNISYEIPSEWKKIEVISIDSNVIGYITKSNDTIFLEIGQHSMVFFNESNPVINDAGMLDFIRKNNPESPNILARDTINDYPQALFLNNYYYYDTINNRVAKLMLPKKKGKGQMGILIDSIDKSNNKFSIYISKILNDKEKDDLIKMFYSITIKE